MQLTLEKSEKIESVSPHLEIGAFEALWAKKEVSSFKQLRNKIVHGEFASGKVSKDEAETFYAKVQEIFKKKGIEHFGIRVSGTADYPKSLLQAEDPLVLLYFLGAWDLIYSKTISVVGTRNPSEEGKKRTARLVRELVENDFTIVSGLAAGVDTVAHETAIESGGKTIAVIGTPLSHSYPKENQKLQRTISEKFLLISQVPVLRYEQDNYKFNRFYFPERNKTMSAISCGTIITEAGETSGTLIQAQAAIKQGRKLFILNSNFENPKLTWPKRLEEKGAIRVRETDDILREFSTQ